MMTCERCKQLLLDYLYGLVEGTEAEALEEHLGTCASCVAERSRMERWRKLLATAARDRFPHVRFSPPRFPEYVVPRSTSFRGASPQPAQPARWLAWAVAAAIWLTGPLLLLSWGHHRQRLQTAQQNWQESWQTLTQIENQLQQYQQQREQQLTEARRRVVSAEQLALGLLDRWVAESRKLQQAAPSPVEIYGPPRLQAGVPNHLFLVWRNPRLAAEGRLLAEIRDQNDAVLFSYPLDPEQSGDVQRQQLRIPARLWTQVTPQSELFLVLVREDERTHHRSPIQEKIRLQGPLYITFLTTDRTRYRPGDTVYFRSLTLDRVHFQPPPREQFLVYALKDRYGRIVRGLMQSGTTSLVRMEGGQVLPVLGPDGQPLRGVGCGAFVLPQDLPDGEYVLEVSERKHLAGYGPQALLPARCNLRIERGPVDQLAKKIDFLAPAFRPGTWVEALAQVHFQGQPLGRQKVEADATVDGQSVPVELTPHGYTDEQGRVRIRFLLPPEERLRRGDVRLQVFFHTPQGRERIARAVPIAGKQVVVEFFPEGGHLVAGIPNRVYFRAATPAGVPVDIRGIITDGQKTLAPVETFRDPDLPGANRSLGMFTFTPELGRHYWLHLTKPSNQNAPLLPESWRRSVSSASAALVGIAGTLGTSRGILLPVPQPAGVVMHVPQPVTRVGEPIRVHLCAIGKPQRRLVIGAYVRGTLLETRRVTLTNGRWEEVTLLSDPRVTSGGVVRLTVYEDASPGGADAADLLPVAERLVFRHGGQRLQIQTEVRRQPGNEGGDASPSATALHISTYDENNQPIPAILYAAVVNSADAPGPQHRLLTTHFLVAGEIQSPDGLEYADFLLSQHPKAPEVLDLVLGTQGWRRFRQWPAQGPTRLAPRAPAVPPPMPGELERLRTNFPLSLITRLGPTLEEAHERLKEQYWPRYEQAMRQWDQARQHLGDLERDPRQQAIFQQLHLRALTQQAAVEQASHQREAVMQVWQPWRQARYTMLVLGLVLTLLCLLAALRRWGHPLPWGVSTAGLLFFLILGMWFFLDVDRILQAAASFPPYIPKGQAWQAKEVVPAEQLGGGDRPLSDADPAPSVAPLVLDSADQTRTLEGKLPQIDPKFLGRSGAHPIPVLHDPLVLEMAGLPPSMLEPTTKAPAMRIPLDIVRERDKEAQSRKHRDDNTPLVTSSEVTSSDRISPPSSAKSPPHTVQLPAAPLAAPGAEAGPSLPRRIGSEAALTQQHQGRQASQRGRTNDERARQIQELNQGQNQAMAFAQQQNNSRTELLQRGWERKLKELNARPSDRDAASSMPSLQASIESDQHQPGNSPREGNDGNQRKNWPLQELLPISAPPLIVREYAPALPVPDSHESADTLLWMPVIVVPETGQVHLPLVLGTARGGYDLIVAGHTQNGRLGAIRTTLPPVSPEPSR